MGLESIGGWRRRVEKALGRRTSDWAWERAVGWAWIADADDRVASGDQTDREAVAWLAGRLRELDDRQRTGAAIAGPRKRADHRGEALAALHARRAEALPEVQAFRRDVLRGRLVGRDRLRAWMEREERRQGPGTRYVRVPLCDDGSPDLGALGPDALLPESLGSRRLAPLERLRQERAWLWYQPDPAAAELRECRVREGATTGRLKRVVDLVAVRFAIAEYDAIALVLCGSRPRAALQYVVRHPQQTHGIARNGGRIALEAVPWLAPQRVAEVFARERRAYGSPRALSEKQARLADFADSVNDGRTWGNALAAWNARARPAWRYDGDTADKRFAAHAGDAFHRLTGERLIWKRKRGERVDAREAR